MKSPITNTLIAKLLPQAKPYDVRDEKLIGFIVRVNPTGKMTYMCEYARGKRIMLGKVGVLTPMQARDKARNLLADFTKGNDPYLTKKQANKVPTLRSFLENEYAPWHKSHAKKGKQDIQRIKIHFLETFGDKRLTEIDTRSVEKWCIKRINDGIKPATINRDITTLKSLFSKALKSELITTHPLNKLKPYKVDKQTKVRYLSKDEELRLRNALDVREKQLKELRKNSNEWRTAQGYEPLFNFSSGNFIDHAKSLVILSLNTGLRRGELLNLRWENVDFAAATLSVAGDTTKNSLTRHIPLNSEALHILKDWRQQSDNRILVFPHKGESEFTNLRRAWCRILKIAQIENFRWHDMRHHFASRLVMASVDLNTVRELLGHSDIKMTLRYAHLAPEHKAEAVAKLIDKSVPNYA